MEFDGGAPYYEAKVTEKPIWNTDGKVIVSVSYCHRQGKTIARFSSEREKAMTLKKGDIVHVCPFDGDAYI